MECELEKGGARVIVKQPGAAAGLARCSETSCANTELNRQQEM